uniref:Ubiquitin-like protease family profile domain-containing protein n=1 Tax=Cucumis melo TaxID=3656 RepID=A0A9I9EJJ3_CUCME
MKEITRARSKGQRLVIEFNELGQAIGQNATKLKSFIGTIVRFHVPITYSGWPTGGFVVDPRSKKPIIQNAGKKSENGKEKRKKHKYNHITSRKGYANLMEELDELIATQKATNAFGEEDILTRALDGNDHPGIVCSVGKYVTKKKYFHTATQQKINEKEDEKVTSKEHDRMAKRIKELEDELLKMKEKDDWLRDLKEEPGMGSKEKSSMEGAENLNDFEDLSNDLESQKDVEDVELNEEIKSSKYVGTPCKLAFETKDHVVAWITIFDSDVEGDNVKVAVDVMVDGDCAIPIPSEQGMYKMSQEVGSHILWPRHLVITGNIKMDYGEFTKDIATFVPTPIQNAPVALRFLLRMVEHIGNHWTLVVINLTKGAAFWIDPLKNRIDPDVTEVVERSFNIMKKKKPNWRVVKCPKQSGVVECGYYVMRFMRDIILSRSTSIIHIMKDSPRAYTEDDIDV